MIRVRFNVSKDKCGNDYRPVKWPIHYPYWCTGENSKDFILVAYADNAGEIKDLWPEAEDIESTEEEKINFTSRFPRPEWYNQKEEGGENV